MRLEGGEGEGGGGEGSMGGGGGREEGRGGKMHGKWREMEGGGGGGGGQNGDTYIITFLISTYFRYILPLPSNTPGQYTLMYIIMYIHAYQQEDHNHSSTCIHNYMSQGYWTWLEEHTQRLLMTLQVHYVSCATSGYSIICIRIQRCTTELLYD